VSAGSPFLDVPPSEHIAGNRSAFAVYDRFPVSDGHALVISRRLIADWWEATPDERSDVLALVEHVKAIVDAAHAPDGYNVGFNAGVAAGQTVAHLHLHVIPRYLGDVPDPRGGIRHVIPDRANYLITSSPAQTPPAAGFGRSPQLFDGVDRALELELIRCLRDPIYDHADLVVSFVMRSGLSLVDEALQDAHERGASVRILTTDYLGITEREALARLLDLSGDSLGRVEVRVFHDGATSFHPKAYLFWSSTSRDALAIVGSSNLSRSGLSGGVEWNVSVEQAGPMLASFTALWHDERSVLLTEEWLREYRPAARNVPPALVVELGEQPVQPVAPRPIQSEALRALEQTRANGFRAGLVVLATGLGKTWLAAFDTARPQFQRVLFVAHREEILRQSRDVFRNVQPDGDLGLYFGQEKQPAARIVFAGIQTLAGRLGSFSPTEFDYIVIDEFHHAAAASYRKVIDYFEPDFLLGLTATPERMDGADLLALCADNLVYDCGLLDGINRAELVPFHYWGVPDPVDFEPIPWRGGRFDPMLLGRAVETQDRAQNAFDEWRAHRGRRTLAFCVSTSHADFMARYFAACGVTCAAVHSAPSSAHRHETLDALRDGTIEVVFAVDLFNEGLDIPEIDTVLMLRPTESPIVFLQQLGRGLRTMEGKEALEVVDFIGNHRSFLSKPRTLLSLGSQRIPSTAAVLAAVESGDFALPVGCSVSYELAAVDMLRELGRVSGRSGLAEYCRSYFEEEGARPSATQAFRAGYQPSSVRTTHGSWHGFLSDLGLLSPLEQATLKDAGEALAGFEVEAVNKAHKLVTLRALLHDGALRTGADLTTIAHTSRTIILRDPRLLRDTANAEFPELASASTELWARYWRAWPIAAWIGELSGKPGRWFELQGTRLVPLFAVDADLGEAFDAMVAEIVEYRLARYLTGKDVEASGAWVCRLSHADGRPIVWLDRAKYPDLPEGETAFMAEGREYIGRFVKIALNTAQLHGQDGNALHGLLRGWFGPSAGQPGTNHQVTIEPVDGTYVMRALTIASEGEADVVPLFPTYAVACGGFRSTDWSSHGGTPMALQPRSDRPPLDPAKHFVCFARGDSMTGGTDPVRHGDPLLFEWIDGGSRADCVGQRVLVEYTDANGTSAALKTLRHDGQTYLLESSNGAQPPIVGQRDMRLVARLVRRLDQTDINPLAAHVGDSFKRQDIPPLYGLEYNPGNWQSGHVSLPGHTVLFVTLTKSEAMAYGSEYVDHFESRDAFVWSSQTSTGSTGKKGREILNALEAGTEIHLWARRRKSDVAFVYLGLVAPVSHKGEKPMAVTFHLLTPVDGDTWKRLHG
jgi:superfamily II DNA or RNA helicase/diadenosine tetraphosphate (Ap4A) HIT family hydrolase/HKD family nuclease